MTLASAAQAVHFSLEQSGIEQATMRLRLALTALTTALSAGGTSAFAPAATAGRHLAAAASMRSPSTAVAAPAAAAPRSYATSATSLQMANVLKLSNPMEEMLNDVDVFIFDCDGVIWRVSLNHLTSRVRGHVARIHFPRRRLGQRCIVPVRVAVLSGTINIINVFLISSFHVSLESSLDMHRYII